MPIRSPALVRCRSVRMASNTTSKLMSIRRRSVIVSSLAEATVLAIEHRGWEPGRMDVDKLHSQLAPAALQAHPMGVRTAAGQQKPPIRDPLKSYARTRGIAAAQ